MQPKATTTYNLINNHHANHIYISIWQVQIKQTTISSVASKLKINKIFKDLSHVCGIADEILITGYDAEERDLDRP